MKKKLFACVLAGSMVLSMAACGGDAQTEPVESTTPSTEVVESTEPAPVEPTPEEVSIDFEDGNMGFVAAYTQAADAADVELSIADFGGSKALAVKNLTGKVPYVGIDATTLLGADVAKVASVEMSMGVSYEDGTFNACSGNIIAWSGEDLVETSDEWSVYLEKANPKKAVASLAAGEEFVADAGNIFLVNLKTDNGATAGKGNATLYIDNIRFLDASGNVLKADSSVAFVGPEKFAGSGVDMSNLCAVTGAVDFEGFAVSEGAWTQNGIDITPEILDALQPGSVVEIAFKSETGNMWIVMPDSAAGWMRVGDGGKSFINNSKNTCQITYEQIAALCGEDKSTWGARMQCESDGAWEVYSVKVGQAAPVYTLGNPVEFAGFSCTGGAWGQEGFEMPQEIIDALVPGSVVEISYATEGSNMWIVMPDSAAGWMRVADGGQSVCMDGKCYITYEQIAALCGEDKSTWGARMQCESDGAWEVFAVRVGTANSMKMSAGNLELPGFACTGTAWGQNGIEMTPEFIAALVPGSVININYTSETGNMWIVMPWATAGWMRVGDGGKSACLNGYCQITYEQIAELCGDDVSTWGTMLQCESDGAWEVYKVTVGQGK